MFDFLILIITLIFFLLIEKEIIKFNFFPIDKPDRIKKIHLKPTSLSGGIFICTYTILILIFFYLFKLENIDYLKTIILLSFFSFCVGFYDDKFFLKPIPPFSSEFSKCNLYPKSTSNDKDNNLEQKKRKDLIDLLINGYERKSEYGYFEIDYHYCSFARDSENMCGKEGNNFKKRLKD